MEPKAKRDATTVMEHAGIGEEAAEEEEEREASGVLLSSMMGWTMSINRDGERACPGSWRPGGRVTSTGKPSESP